MSTLDINGVCRRSSVFVTTENLEGSRHIDRGLWFELKDYADVEAFEAAAQKFATTTLKDDSPLRFLILNADFNYPALWTPKKIQGQTWELLALDDYDTNIFHAYVGKFGLWQGYVKDTIRLMNANFLGYFNTKRDYLDSDRNASMDNVVNVNGYYFTDH